MNKDKGRRPKRFIRTLSIMLLYFAVYVFAYQFFKLLASDQDLSLRNISFISAIASTGDDQIAAIEPAAGDAEEELETPSVSEAESYVVQAVLSPKRQAVIASGIDAKITKFDIESGDVFKKGQVLIEYDCSVDQARLMESQSRQRVTQRQLEAYQKLRSMESVSDMELVMATESNEQNKAMIEQIRGRLKYCKHIAPFDGRVMNKMAAQHEFVQPGRVLMDISSLEPLRAEFLIPSKWLRWLNIGTPLQIQIDETDRSYSAKIVAIRGEVDPVSQSLQVVAEMEAYHEELLPGMSGQAVFSQEAVSQGQGKGFLGLVIGSAVTESNDTTTE